MAVKSRDKPKAVERDDYTVHRRGTGKTVGVAQPFLTGIILTNPAAVAQTVSLIFSFSWMNAVGLVVIIVGGMVIELILRNIHDSRIWKEILGHYFPVFDDCCFEPIKIELEGSKKIRDVLRYPMSPFLLQSRFLMPKIRAFYVRPKNKRTLLTSPKAYQMAGGTSYVFLHQKPEKTIPRFFLLHEIGHAFVTNHLISKLGWFAVVYFCLLFVFVAFHREAGILALLVAFALAAMWAHYWVQQGNTDEPLELAADAFALVHLAKRPDFRTEIARISRAFRKSKDRYRVRPLVRRAQILSRTEGFGINWIEHVAPSIPLWLGLLILAGMLWLGITLSIKDLQELLALSLVWVVVPGLVHYYRTFLRSVKLPGTFWSRRKAVDFLQEHVPEYDLRLTAVAAKEDLPKVGHNLIIVALVGADLQIRIFDASGNIVLDKAGNKLIVDKTMTALKKQLNPFHESSLSKEEKQQVLRNALYNLLW